MAVDMRHLSIQLLVSMGEFCLYMLSLTVFLSHCYLSLDSWLLHGILLVSITLPVLFSFLDFHSLLLVVICFMYLK